MILVPFQETSNWSFFCSLSGQRKPNAIDLQLGMVCLLLAPISGKMGMVYHGLFVGFTTLYRMHGQITWHFPTKKNVNPGMGKLPAPWEVPQKIPQLVTRGSSPKNNRKSSPNILYIISF